MIKLFRTNQFVVNILLPFYVLLVRFPVFFTESVESNVSGGFGWQLLGLDSWNVASLLGILLAGSLIGLHGLLINIIEYQFKLSGELTLVPGICYILLASAIPESFYFSPLLIAIFFLLLAIHQMFECYKQYSPAVHIFNIGFWLSISYLFYSSIIIYILFAILALVIIRNFKAKELLMLLIGFLTPLALVAVYSFWRDELGVFYEIQFVQSLAWRDWMLNDNLQNLFPLLFIGIIFLGSIIGYQKFSYKKGIQDRKSIDVFYWSMIFAGITFLVQPKAGIIHLLLLVPSLAFGLTFLLFRLTPSRAEAFHFFLLISVILWQFNPW